MSTPEPAPDLLHPETDALVTDFADALRDKLLRAQQRMISQGTGDGLEWTKTEWEAECNLALHRHVRKGDPRDVAAYCAFMWHHGWRIEEIPSAEAGAACCGGFYAGKLFIGNEPHALIVAPKAEGEFADVAWRDSGPELFSATSYFDGMANTLAMAEAGSELAKRILALRIGDFEDWHLPSRAESFLLGMELRRGEGAAMLPESERFARDWYWTSTHSSEDMNLAWAEDMHGRQDALYDSDAWRARAVRTIKL